MVSKGQVSIINVVPPGRSKENNHSIYINLKTISEREQDITLLDKVYQYLLTRAKQLKVTLPQEYGTILCVGNDSKETANNQFFIQKGYLPLNSLYSMNRDLTEPVLELKLQEEFQFSHTGAWRHLARKEITLILKLKFGQMLHLVLIGCLNTKITSYGHPWSYVK